MQPSVLAVRGRSRCRQRCERVAAIAEPANHARQRSRRLHAIAERIVAVTVVKQHDRAGASTTQHSIGDDLGLRDVPCPTPRASSRPSAVPAARAIGDTHGFRWPCGARKSRGRCAPARSMAAAPSIDVVANVARRTPDQLPMMIAVVADDVAVGCHALDDRRPAVGVSAEHEEGRDARLRRLTRRGRRAWRRVGAVVERQRRRPGSLPGRRRWTRPNNGLLRSNAPQASAAHRHDCGRRNRADHDGLHAAIRSAPRIRAYRPRIMSLTRGQPYDSAR